MTRTSANDRRRQLTDAAVAILIEEGPSGLTTRAVAGRARAPLGTVHYAFAGKDELLAAAAGQILGSFAAALRERVDEALACVGETEVRMGQIESRKRLVDEVQLKTNVITNMLEDVRLNLETLGEQKAVVDHVMESFSRLNEKVQEAQTTLRSLQAERELAERIERGIKQLRKTAAPDEKQRLA